MYATAVSGRERDRAIGIEVGGRDEPDLGVGQGVVCIPGGDVAGPDDADAEGGHGRRGYGIQAGARAAVRRST